MSEPSNQAETETLISRKNFLRTLAAAGALGAASLALSEPIIPSANASITPETDADPASYIITIETDGSISSYDGSSAALFENKTDAATVIKDTINALVNTGGLVFVKKGTYAISTALNVIDNVVLQGESMTKTNLVWTSPYTQPTGYFGVVNMGSGAQVLNLSIYAASPPLQPIDGVFQFETSRIGKIERVQILNATSNCIEARGRRLAVKQCFWNASYVNVTNLLNHPGATDVLIDGCFAEDDGSTTQVGIVNTSGNATERVIVSNNFAHLQYVYPGTSPFRLIDFQTPRCESNHNVIVSDVLQTSGNIVGIRLGHGLGDAYNFANGNILWNLVSGIVADEVSGTGITGDPNGIGNNYIKILNNILYQGGLDFGDNVFALVDGNVFFGNNGQTGIRGQFLYAIFRNNHFINKTTYGVALAATHTTWDSNMFVDYQQTPTMNHAFDLQGTSLGNNIFQNNRVANINPPAPSLFGTGTLPSTSVARNNPGFNPQGVLAISVGASPFTYTNSDNVPEAIYIVRGALSQVAKNSTNLFTTTNVTVWLEPGESVTVTYSSAPSMFKDRK